MQNQGQDPAQMLTPDENILRDFIETRMKKAEAEIMRLCETGNDDLNEWTTNFDYLIRTYGKPSTEPFKLFKYYMRQGSIPKSVARPLLIQLYMDSTVDAGFVNLLTRVMREEDEAAREARISELRDDLGRLVDEDGYVTAYRGAFEKPFGVYDDASRPFEKAFAFTTDPEAAKHYACCWYPGSARLITARVPLEEIAWYGAYQEDKTLVILPVFKGGKAELTSSEDYPESAYEENKIDRKTAFAAYVSSFKN